jgi:hypothetical protein
MLRRVGRAARRVLDGRRWLRGRCRHLVFLGLAGGVCMGWHSAGTPRLVGVGVPYRGFQLTWASTVRVWASSWWILPVMRRSALRSTRLAPRTGLRWWA